MGCRKRTSFCLFLPMAKWRMYGHRWAGKSGVMTKVKYVFPNHLWWVVYKRKCGFLVVIPAVQRCAVTSENGELCWTLWRNKTVLDITEKKRIAVSKGVFCEIWVQRNVCLYIVPTLSVIFHIVGLSLTLATHFNVADSWARRFSIITESFW